MTEISQDELITDITPIAFNLGSVVLTRGIDELCGGNHALLLPLLKRHDHCDWGNCDPEDAISNNWATHNEQRIMSVYECLGEAVWIITEWDRSVTTILLPSEY